MNYHNILHDDMVNGEGLRVVLFVSGCDHHCEGCQNPQTWKVDSGIPFDEAAVNEIMNELENPYIDGITFSGGDPLHPNNLPIVKKLCEDIKLKFENRKTIWLYTGYTIEEIIRSDELKDILSYIDILVDGKFEKDKVDVYYCWAGSTNQRVINIKELNIGKKVE